MRKLIIVLFLLLPSYAMAQVVETRTLENRGPGIAPVAPKVEEKAKPVIVPAAKMQEVFSLMKDVQIAVLTIENANAKIKELNALIEKAKADGQKSDAAVTEFWAKIGIKRAELETLWKGVPGQNGDVILTKEVEDKPKTP